MLIRHSWTFFLKEDLETSRQLAGIAFQTVAPNFEKDFSSCLGTCLGTDTESRGRRTVCWYGARVPGLMWTPHFLKCRRQTLGTALVHLGTKTGTENWCVRISACTQAKCPGTKYVHNLNPGSWYLDFTCCRRRWKYCAGVVGFTMCMLTLSPSSSSSLLSVIWHEGVQC